MTKEGITLFLSVFFIFSGLAVKAADNTQPPEGKYFYIKSVQAGSQNLGFWDQPGKPSRFKKGANLALYAKDGYADQQFKFMDAGAGMYYIVSKNGGYVDIAGGKSSNGTNVLIWEGHKKSNQKFRLKHTGDGKWKILTYTNRAVCTPRKYSNGTNVHIWEDHNGSWTEWYLVDASTGANFGAETYSKTPDFFLENKDRAFNYSSQTLVGGNRGTAYVARIDFGRNILLGLDYTGINPMDGKKMEVSTFMRLYYDKGQYKQAASDPEFQLVGKAGKDDKRLSMSHSQGGITLEVTGKSKASVIPSSPMFFINNRTKQFEFSTQTAFSGGTRGTAKVITIKGNAIELKVTEELTDEKTGKKTVRNSTKKLYYIDGQYTFNYDGYVTYGYAGGSDNVLSISGEQDSTDFKVK